MKNQIVSAARGWLGTRFHHQGRLKKSENNKGGVDCLGLLIGISAELNLPFTEQDETSYSHSPDTQKLREKLAHSLQEINISEINYGDILLLNIDGQAQHLAIVSDMADGIGIIHAYAPARAVVEHALDAWWREKIVVAFRVTFG